MKEPSRLLQVFHQHSSICTDTRKLKQGDLFFALKGPRFNGNEFALKALEQGASYAIIDESQFAIPGDNRFILVENALKALQDLSHERRQELGITMIGLTGSNGKTTTKELIASVLQTEKRIYATEGNFNNHIGVPLTLLRIPEETEIAIVEMGANQPGDIQELAEIADPDMGLITNVGYAHLEKLGSLEGVRQTKGALFHHVGKKGGTLFVNEADERVSLTAQPYSNQITYGLEKSDFSMTIEGISLDSMSLVVSSKNWDNPLNIQARVTGEHNAKNILAAVAVAQTIGISPENIQKGIASYVSENNRSQLVQKGSYKIWLDAYNANPSSMKAALQNYVQVEGQGVALILGDMLELGDEGIHHHEVLGEYIQTLNPSVLIGVGPLMKHTVDKVKANSYWFAERDDMIPHLPGILQECRSILIKGSRGIALEKILDHIE